MQTLLKLGRGNAKLGKDTLIFNLPAGHTCPGAKDCFTKVVEQADGKRKIIDGPANVFRCYAATAEGIYPKVFDARKFNHDLILPLAQKKDVQGMVELILASMAVMPMDKINRVRVHESGDYFTFSYFAAWMAVATAFPHIKFYSYTKSLPHVVRGRKEGIIPPNFIFTASKGGKFDYLIEREGFKSVTVTTTQAETDAAKANGGKFDHDDSLALGDSDFFLQVHGVQPKGTAAAKYWDSLMKQGKGGYNKTKRNGVLKDLPASKAKGQSRLKMAA